MPSKVKLLNTEELEKMHTGSLMKLRNELLACEVSFEISDRFGHEDEPNPSITKLIEFKDTIEWQEAYKKVKNILSFRENLPNRVERKTMRVKRSKNNRARWHEK